MATAAAIRTRAAEIRMRAGRTQAATEAAGTTAAGPEATPDRARGTVAVTRRKSRSREATTNLADPPRLVLRFATCTCVALALAAAAVLMVVRHLVTVQAEHAATTQARVIANSSFRGSLLASDFARPVDGDRRAALDGLVRTTALREDVLMVELYAHDGEATYSTDHRRIGRRSGQQRRLVGEGLTATVRGDATTLPAGAAGSDHPRRVLRTYAPVPVKGG